MVRVLVPSGALGLNYDKDALARGVAAKPDLIAIDGGSTDSGPSYLGRGVSKYARSSTKIEWAGLMAARAEAGCPLVIGTAGTCGSDSAVDWLLDITREIAEERGEHVKVAVLRSQQTANDVSAALGAGRVHPLGNAPEISDEVLNSCTNIVALAGADHIVAALETGADIIIAGRATDTAIIAAMPLMRGLHAGAAWHGAKIGECGALCATNPQSGVILIDFDAEGFTITPQADGAVATPHTVSAHMLYENSDPFILYEPGGYLDVTAAEYVQSSETAVRVTGSKWIATAPYTVKLEGAAPAGFQSVLIALVRDPHYVQNIQTWADDIHAKCCAKVRDRLGLDDNQFSIDLRLMGHSATFGMFETQPHTASEIGVLGIVTAQSEAQCDEIAKMLNPYLLHHPLTVEEEVPTFAFPFSPADLPRGQTYEFVLNHVMELDDPMQAVRMEVHDLG